MIRRETIDKIFGAVRVEEIIGEYVQLKRAGANLKGLSPFKEERTPSFVVSPSKQIWKDFSTGKGGNAVSFLMEIEGFTYPEALRHIAKKYAIDIEDDRRELTEEEKNSQSERDQLYKIHEVANAYFQEVFWNTEEGKLIAQSYFKERGLTEATIRKFQLGFSPGERSAFTFFAQEKGYSKETLAKSGLSIFPEDGQQGYDRFRERVMFPIFTFSGRVIGFGGRILKSNAKAAKYVNSPETDIYHKSNVLYGLSQSKQAISRQDECLLVEGYMDVISLHQSGIENVVASSGTSLTEEQIRLIKRLTENIIILFDGDEAGLKASFRSIDMILAQNLNVRILLFPEGEDPDSFSRKNTAEYVQKFIQENSRDFVEFKSEVLLKDATHDPIKKAAVIRDIVQSVAQIPNNLRQEIYIKEIAAKFSLSEKTLFAELQATLITRNKKNVPTPASAEKPKMEIAPAETFQAVNPVLFLEESLINLLLNYGEKILMREDTEGNAYEITVLEEIIHHLSEDDYQPISPHNQKIIQEVRQGLENQELRGVGYFTSLMDPEIDRLLADVLVEEHSTANWSQFGIYFPTEAEYLPQMVREVRLRHKREYVLQIIAEEKKAAEDKMPDYNKIMALAQLKRMLDEELTRIV